MVRMVLGIIVLIVGTVFIAFLFVIIPMRKVIMSEYDYDKIYMVSYSRDKVLQLCEKLAG